MSSLHWDTAYVTKSVEERSWSQVSPSESLAFISEIPLDVNASIIDIGGGSSTLVDELLIKNFTDVSVLDISLSALEEVRARLRNKGLDPQKVHWLCEDLTQWTPQRNYDLWHDRAVFHFLTTQHDQQQYLQSVLAGTQSGSHVLMATFAPTGPESCSGLPVSRWSVQELQQFFGDQFTLIKGTQLVHTTPWGSTQDFTWAHFQRS